MVNSSGCLLRRRCERPRADAQLPEHIVSSARRTVEPDFAANYRQISSAKANVGSARSRFVESGATDSAETPQESEMQQLSRLSWCRYVVSTRVRRTALIPHRTTVALDLRSDSFSSRHRQASRYRMAPVSNEPGTCGQTAVWPDLKQGGLRCQRCLLP
jgi:hypothetical protein